MSVILLLVKMVPPAKILLDPIHVPVHLVSKVRIASITSTTVTQIHAKTVVSATTWLTPFHAHVRTVLWAFSVRSTSTNVSKELVTMEVHVSIRSVHLNVNAHLVSLDHVAKVTSMNVYPIHARLPEPSTACSLLITTVVIANRVTWDDIASSKSIFVKYLLATMEACASTANWVIPVSVRQASLERIAIPAPNVIQHLVRMAEPVDPINKDSSALVHQVLAELDANWILMMNVNLIPAKTMEFVE
jgi:hypothetical protein